ncbi:hypothetical protein ABFS83_14G184900 [Erythranthe nasuta]
MMCFKNSVFGSCLMLVAFTCWINANISEAFGTFGLDIHHRYSDTVKQFLNVDGLPPEKGTVDYYTAMVHRDQLFKGRRLAACSTPILTFVGIGGNQTYNMWALGYLHYSIVNVGTPASSFLVALDTNSDLFWVPCDCKTCPRYFNMTDETRFELSIYSPSNSTTSSPLPCNSTLCGPTRTCLTRSNTCAYQQLYGASSSTGILVDDVLHLGSDTNPQDPIDVSVTFGCGKNQTGYFLESGGGINGVFGLGMGGISVPSILASKSVTANSFSMCFSDEYFGRIEFGDKGSPEQKTTPFNLQKSNPTYNITVIQIGVGNNVTNLEFTANFNTGTAVTHLTDPAYSFIVNNFNSHITEKRYHYPADAAFDHCYVLRANQSIYTTPNLTFTMKGGNQFNVTAPTIQFREVDGYVYCLAIIKSEGINVIGQNFMTGYRLVFDREDMVLGWKESDCSDSVSLKTPSPPNGNSTRSRQPQQSPPPPPTTTPTTTKPNGVSSMTSGLVMVILAVFFHIFIVL